MEKNVCTRMHVCCVNGVFVCVGRAVAGIAVGAIASSSSSFFSCILFHSFSLNFFVVDRLSSIVYVVYHKCTDSDADPVSQPIGTKCTYSLHSFHQLK